nr:delta12 fatty acid desaturase [Bemisia tabaci]
MGVQSDCNENHLPEAPRRRAPTARPPFTLADLKRAVPAHCFERSLPRSAAHVLADVGAYVLLGVAGGALIPALPWWGALLAWPLHWFLQGTLMIGLWVLAHECGHHAFSRYKRVNDAVGFAIHTSLLVPYFSLQVSHARHHANTGSAEHDELFCPKQRSGLGTLHRLTENPAGRILKSVLSMAAGWPLYLAINITGRSYEGLASHFDPFSPIFRDSHRLKVLLSDLGIVTMIGTLYYLSATFGLWWLTCHYLMPFVFLNGWLVVVAYLNHTHPAFPRYASQEWDWFRGALSTVDRDYWVFNHLPHHITDTHVMHHLLPTIPHYHAVEASEAIKPILGAYYNYDSTPILKAFLWESIECLFIEPQSEGDGVLWFSGRFHHDGFFTEFKNFLVNLTRPSFYGPLVSLLATISATVARALANLVIVLLSPSYYLETVPRALLSLGKAIAELLTPIVESIAPLASSKFYRETLPRAAVAPFTASFYREVWDILAAVWDYSFMAAENFLSIMSAFAQVYLLVGETVKNLVLGLLNTRISINVSYSHDTVRNLLASPLKGKVMPNFAPQEKLTTMLSKVDAFRSTIGPRGFLNLREKLC